ncbi:MAG: hypothetical protein HRU06_21320 [Oceanospirillaceae bacterium]|nr:hypothetical protein [Oceanospirillaceae bacterium]
MPFAPQSKDKTPPLDDGRVDIVVATAVGGLLSLKSYDFQKIVSVPSGLKGASLYHYLNVKHRQLVSKINQVLVNMTREGDN